MSDFRFAEPVFVHLLWGVVALCVGLFLLDRRGGRLLDALVSPSLRERLVDRPAAWRRRARILLIGAALAFAVLALMRPQWGLRYVTTSRASAEIMICLDVSRSMLAEDVVPSRLERAKAEIVDLLGFLDGDQVGLIAFAGRATVVAPLTPDFGFLRLVLGSVGPGSVTRGGTRLAEPMRKALAGFATAGDAARVVLLITDGEDQDSFPLDAARELREAGVRVVAIGIGDESGTEVRVRDPRTGLTELLRDADGAPVITRLDGDTLRDIVSETKGVYIPAGVGSLDLAEIYDAYIRDLLRAPSAGRGRAVREEGYQWAALLALLCLVASVGVASGRPRAQSSVVGEIARRAAILALITWLPAAPTVAQEGDASDGSPPATAADPGPAAGAEPAAPSTAGGAAASATAESEGPAGTGDAGSPISDEKSPETPRETYNTSLGALGAGDFDAAELQLRRARSDGADDAELRFRATYNLGISNARRASALEQEDPEGALQMLYAAADRFRGAVAQRPEDADARHNLEVTLRRALALADEIARRGRGDLAEELEKLAERERGILQSTAAIASSFASEATTTDPAALERERRAYRGVGAEQRLLLSDGDLVARQVESERAAIDATPEEERTPEQQVRAAQLGFVADHLFEARQHMGQARSQMRRRQGGRAIRRASSALADIKRAQEQLRAPPQVLDGIVRDAVAAANRIGLVRASRSGAEDAPEAPGWLTSELLTDAERDLVERTDELAQRMRAAIGPADDAAAIDVRRAAIERAAEGIDTARADLESAATAIEGDQLDAALERHAVAIRALLEAREWLLDLRGLIELAYGDQTTLAAELAREGVAAQALRAFGAVQTRNLERIGRMGPLLDDEMARIESDAAQAPAPGAPGPGAAPPSPEQIEAERKRIELAREALARIPPPMREAEQALASAKRAKARAAAERARENLALLRRLFFSVVELLRETAQRQVELVDETVEVESLAGGPDRRATALADVDREQAELEATANAISTDLEEQSRQQGGVLAEEPAAAEVSEKLRKASEYVLFAAGDMATARAAIAGTPESLEPAREAQKKAIEQLARAIALLVPPEQEPPPQDDPEDSEQSPPQPQPQGGDGESDRERDSAERMLQAVRDREAKRQEDLSDRRARQSGYDTVEKDW